uniref:B3 domain-containing protein n=1 Tax=Triticum monococcum TaxID=4568 RepID=A0A8K1Z797_TRIMO|nr:B3 domain-containing protein [Triticum monococcum]
MDMDRANQGCGEDCDAEGCECGADGCEECEWWRLHCYWSHAGDRPRHFSLVAGDDFADHMRIRPPVASHLRNLITEFKEIQLEAPDGRVYPVKIGWEFGDIVLRSGWYDFVKVHHIEQNSSIRFVYRGNSSFEVHISGPSGHDNSSPPPPRDRPVLNEQVVPDPAHVQTSIDIDYTAFPGTRLSHEQEKKVLELAQSSMGSEFRLHVAAVNKRNANGDCHVYIPLTILDIFKEGITEAPIQLKAHSNDMIYVVGASKHGDDQVILQSKLSHFVDGHRMQDNDLLVFRSKGKAQLEVLVLDPSGCEKTWFDTGNSSNVSREGRRAQAQNTASTSFGWAKSGLQARESNEAGLQAPRSNNYISTQSTPLHSQQKEKVEERVRAIGSQFPVFVKVVSSSEVVTKTSLYLGPEYASACLLTQRGRLRLLLEGDDRDWDCRLGLRKSNKTWWIDGAWPKFISDVGLEEDDICLFELTDTSRFTMKVHVIRKSDIPAP